MDVTMTEILLHRIHHQFIYVSVRRHGGKKKSFCSGQGRTREFGSVGGGVQQIQLRTEDRKKGDLGCGSPLVRGSGGSCNLVQDISFHIVKFS
jgi:hypothetical protein